MGLLCTKCGEELGGYNWREKLYCVDCWPGYDECADERCGHYRIEHDVRLGEAVYVKPGREAMAAQLANTEWIGCANADCPCLGFREPSSAGDADGGELDPIVPTSAPET